MHQKLLKPAFSIFYCTIYPQHWDTHHICQWGVREVNWLQMRTRNAKLCRFKGAYIDSGAVDFSDKLRTSRRKGLTIFNLAKRESGKFGVDKCQGFLCLKSLRQATQWSGVENLKKPRRRLWRSTRDSTVRYFDKMMDRREKALKSYMGGIE